MSDPGFTDLKGEAGFSRALLALNNGFAAELSLLDAIKARQLVQQAFMARAISDAALLLAFDQDADYDSPNFLWFQERYDRFVYVDRVVVSPKRQGTGLARLLYESLFAQAVARGHTRVTCEINIDPPNPRSEAFHAGLGFVPMGEARLHKAGKTVRYFCKPVR